MKNQISLLVNILSNENFSTTESLCSTENQKVIVDLFVSIFHLNNHIYNDR